LGESTGEGGIPKTQKMGEEIKKFACTGSGLKMRRTEQSNSKRSG
jgi:hypothetical protein